MKRRKKYFFFECRGAFVARVREFFCGRGYWSFLSMAGDFSAGVLEFFFSMAVDFWSKGICVF